MANFPSDLYNLKGPKDCTTQLELVDYFRDVVNELTGEAKENEHGVVIVSNNGDLAFFRGFSEGEFDSIRIMTPSDASSVVSAIHSHPPDGSNLDLENRYPSDVDWVLIGQDLVDRGADPDVLTLGIVDGQGAARLFRYSDRALYQGMTSSQRQAGENLPPDIPDDADTGMCVEIEFVE